MHVSDYRQKGNFYMRKKKLCSVALMSILMMTGAASGLNYINENIVVKAVDYGIKIDASQTKIEGAGLAIYLADKPNIELADITVTIDSFESTQFAGYKDAMLEKGVNKVEYIPSTGRFYGTVANGFPDKSDIKMKVTISYTIGADVYKKQLLFEGNIYNSSYGLDGVVAPTNAKITDNVLTFDEAANATGYHIEYRGEDKVTVYGEQDVANGETLKAILNPGTYYVFIKSLGDGLDIGDSEYVEVAGTYVAKEVTGLPINIDANNTKIVGSGLEIFLTDKPNISLNDITIIVDSFESTQFAGYKDGFLKNGVNKVDYNSGNGRFYGTLFAGFPDDTDVVVTMRLIYSLDNVTYLQQLVFVGNHYKPNYGKIEALSTPTNVTISDNKLVFDEVTNAVGYHVQYKDETNAVVAEHDIMPNGELTAKLDSGTYTLYLKALGDETTYNDSEYVEVSTKIVIPEKELPTLGAPIAINAANTKIEGSGIFICLKDTPDIELFDITVKVVDSTSASGDGLAESIKTQRIKKVRYNKADGVFYGTMGVGIPAENCDLVTTIRISYTKDNVTYLQEVVFDACTYAPEKANDCNLGYNYAYGVQKSLDQTKVRYIGKVYLGDKLIEDLANKFKELQFTITAEFSGETKHATLSTNKIMKSLQAMSDEGLIEIEATEGWYFFAVTIDGVPSDFNTISVTTSVLEK